MIAWGVCCVCMGVVSNYAGLLGARMALGLAEGGLFPGITYVSRVPTPHWSHALKIYRSK